MNFNQIYAIMGAAIATLASQFIFLSILTLKTRKEFKIKARYDILINMGKPIIASIIMAVVLLAATNYFNLITWTKLILIPLGIVIYLPLIILLKGITLKEIKHLYQTVLSKKKIQ